MLFSKTSILALAASAPFAQAMTFITNQNFESVPDFGIASSTMVINSDMAICDLNVRVNIEHTFEGDLDVTLSLTSPGGDTFSALLANTDCGGNDNLIETFDDQATVMHADTCEDGGMFVEPAMPLSIFNGQSVGGTWTLTIDDTFSGDDGTLTEWELQIIPCESDAVHFIVNDFEPIADNGGPIAFSNLDVDTDLEICDVNVRVDIDHSFEGDLDVSLSLTSPGGEVFSTQLARNSCGGNDNLIETFDDQALIMHSEGCEDGGAFVTPTMPLAIFNGESTAGTWTLSIDDTFGGDIGNLNQWELIVVPCTGTGTGMGDPHFQTWGGLWYDFHGQCDLVYLEDSEFGAGEGLTVHIRTSPRYAYSYIETAAIKIGEDVLEVSAWGEFFVNGVDSAVAPDTMLAGKYAVKHTQVNKKRHLFEIDLLEGQKIVVTTHKDLVAITMEGAKYHHFNNSVGLLGNFVNGHKLGRNGTAIGDANTFGQEWQVLSSEPKLFQSIREPQHPTQCVMPSATKSETRRLGQTIAEDAAEAACAHWVEMKEQCIFDVMISGDLELADAAPGAY